MYGVYYLLAWEEKNVFFLSFFFGYEYKLALIPIYHARWILHVHKIEFFARGFW